jgi:hypothetical protein
VGTETKSEKKGKKIREEKLGQISTINSLVENVF